MNFKNKQKQKANEIMKEQILIHQNDPGQLEKLYRTDKHAFKREFKSLYPQLTGSLLAHFWNERLNYNGGQSERDIRKEITFAVIASLVAGLIAKLPALLSFNEEFFYQRNAGFIVFPLLTVYFAWKNQLSARRISFAAGTILAGMIFINFLPEAKKSDTLILSCIHLPIFLWFVLGFAFVAGKGSDRGKRLDFLKYNGDLVVMTALILIAGGILTGVTLGLFSLIGLHIEKFYFENVGIIGLAAAPIAGTCLIRTNPNLVGKVSPVIAKIFSPLVLVMLLVYLAAIAYSGKNPYNDRDFLLMFNALLIGVMAIIFFSVSGTPAAAKGRAEIWVLFLLSAVTIVVNVIALSAILFRISEWGFTPNRTAVLGSNVLVLVNLVLVAVQLFKVLLNKAETSGVGRYISSYLPLYGLWAFVVTVIFPLIFAFK